jgi:hypothetical protein
MALLPLRLWALMGLTLGAGFVLHPGVRSTGALATECPLAATPASVRLSAEDGYYVGTAG